MRPDVKFDAACFELEGALAESCPKSLLKAYAWDISSIERADSEQNPNPTHSPSNIVNNVRKAFENSPVVQEHFKGTRDYNVPIAQLPMIISPYYEGGSLAHRFNLRNADGDLFSITEVVQVFTDMVDGLDVFWKQEKTHNDLKFANILTEVSPTKCGHESSFGRSRIHQDAYIWMGELRVRRIPSLPPA